MRGRQSSEETRYFDPALRHRHANLSGDPITFPDAESRRVWHDTRHQILNHLLRLVAGSHWEEHLVLRGSLLLKNWMGEAAREPRDIDWVFRPASVAAQNVEGKLAEEMTHLLRLHPQAGGATLSDSILVDRIWAYERMEGRRLTFSWQREGLPPGTVQMDIAFGEELFADPIRTPILTRDGSSIELWSATPELSLAWKLLWLQTDNDPQGKDLYDATLLAERLELHPPFLDLLYRLLKRAESLPPSGLLPDFPMKWEVDWDNFKAEYPSIWEEAFDLQDRLTTALLPIFVSS